MKSIYDYIKELEPSDWNYYFPLDSSKTKEKPFIETENYSEFILNYFKKGGKVEIFESCGISPKELRLPNHICSVFFLGILLYKKTKFHKKYVMGNNDPGYRHFHLYGF